MVASGYSPNSIQRHRFLEVYVQQGCVEGESRVRERGRVEETVGGGEREGGKRVSGGG